MEIRKLTQPEKPSAMCLVWDVFLEFEAHDYVEEGVATFRDFINDESSIKALAVYGAFEKRKLAGVIATRNGGNHIALFFVHKDCQRRGIGRKLFETVLENSTSKVITVNSSPYATEIYHKLGFSDTGAERTTNGMRYTPMKYVKDEQPV